MQPSVLERILDHAARAVQAPDAPEAASARARRPSSLTEREREVLERAARGERSKEIAAGLGITERTVGAHLTSIYTKLGVDSRAGAVARGIERGLLHRRE